MQWSRIVSSLVLMLCVSSAVFADASKQATAQRIQEEKELAKLNPEEFRLLVLGTQIFLGRFGYGVGPFTGEFDQRTQEALRAYQKYTGISETGTINKETLKHLTDDNGILDRILPFLPQFEFEDKNWPETVSAHGTWAMENLPVSEALQTSHISCHRKWNLCSVSTAKLDSGYTPTLLSQTNMYEVKAWNDSDIVTKPLQSGPCVSTILRIQREEKTITRQTTFERTQTGPCAKTPTRKIQRQLVDGSQIYWAMKQQKNRDAQRILRVKQATGSKTGETSKP